MDASIVIVGGGPAGIATALFFAAAAPHLAERIVILEKERYPREKICAGAIGARADRLLASIGVRVDVPSVPVRGLSIATVRGSSASRGPSGEPIGRVVRRVEFDRAFAAAARDRGLRILEGARVRDVTFEPSHVRLQLEDGELRARAIVGADGIGSVVRRALGAPRGTWLAQVVEVDTPWHDSDREPDLLHFDITDRTLVGYGWDFPTIVAGRALVCRGVYELRPDPAALGLEPPADPPPDVGERILTRLRALGLDEGARLKRFAERGLALHEPVARPRALLVGEAAGIDPVLGEGIAQAIFYGAAAGPYLARCLAADELSFAGWRRELFRSRIGLDLGIRARLPPFIYGRSRPVAERWVVGSRDLAAAGLSYFAGERVSRRKLAGAALDLGTAAASAWIDATSRRWAAST